tara:strand:- start:4149 stop:4424 length:276 start_codon:yes stop_codon:yes gene_type:complete
MIKLKNHRNNSFCDIKDKGANNIKIGNCIKIKNSKKTFQIVGLNHKRKICWVREWPLKDNSHATFELSVNNILIPTICRLKIKSNDKSENV